MKRRRPVRDRPLVVHLTTVDMSLALLLLPQLVAFRDDGYDVVGVSAPGRWVDQLEEAGIRHIALEHSTRANRPWDDLRAMLAFWRLCRQLRPDVVHTHNPKPGLYGRIAARLAGVPVVVNTVHGLYALPHDPLPKRVVVYALERIASIFSDAELIQNPEDVPTLRRLRIPAHKLYLLGNGVDLTRFDPSDATQDRREVRAELGIADTEVVIGAVGRLVREKGYLELFHAVRQLSIRDEQLRFVVVGPHEPAKADALTQKELDELTTTTPTLLLGLRDDVERLYPAFDVYVLASHREGFPRSAMEAAAMQLPIVTTDVRGCRQVVDDELTGLLVPVGDADALAAALDRLISDPDLRKSYGQAARSKAEREFDDRRQVELTLQVYSDLLAPRRER